MSATEEEAPQRRTFADGFLLGLAAPALLLSGALTRTRRTRISGLDEIWRDVGQFIRASTNERRSSNNDDDRSSS